MKIPAYQIHNVLKAFSRQLVQNGDSESKPNNDFISSGGKRQAVVDKITTNIVNKITKMDARAESFIQIGARSGKMALKRIEFKKTGFIYNEIGEDNRKTTRKLSIEDTANQDRIFRSLSV